MAQPRVLEKGAFAFSLLACALRAAFPFGRAQKEHLGDATSPGFGDGLNANRHFQCVALCGEHAQQPTTRWFSISMSDATTIAGLAIFFVAANTLALSFRN